MPPQERRDPLWRRPEPGPERVCPLLEVPVLGYRFVAEVVLPTSNKEEANSDRDGLGQGIAPADSCRVLGERPYLRPR